MATAYLFNYILFVFLNVPFFQFVTLQFKETLSFTV